MISNTSIVTPTYSAFTPELGSRLPGLASERYATLGGRVKEKGGRFDSFEDPLVAQRSFLFVDPRNKKCLA